MTCRDCQLSHAHRDHRYKELTEIAEESKGLMEKMVAELRYKSEVISVALSQCEVRASSLDERKAQVRLEIVALVTK